MADEKLFDNWFDPVETELRTKVRGFSKTMIEEELETALSCPPYARRQLEEAGDKLFTFTRFPKSQWKSIGTSNAIERLHEEFNRRIKAQTDPPPAENSRDVVLGIVGFIVRSCRRTVEGVR